MKGIMYATNGIKVFDSNAGLKALSCLSLVTIMSKSIKVLFFKP
jgi:hypothetical protein